MPRSTRKARAQHVRNHKRAAKRQAAQNNRSAGRKTLPASQRNKGGFMPQVMRAIGLQYMMQHFPNLLPEVPNEVRQFSKRKTV